MGALLDLGDMPHGRRRVVPISGGTFEGPRLKGSVVPGGADWQIVRADGVLEIVARYELRVDDGTLIHVVNTGVRVGSPEIVARLMRGEAVDPSLYYFRTAPRFEAPPGPHDWLNRHLFVGVAWREAQAVRLTVYCVL